MKVGDDNQFALIFLVRWSRGQLIGIWQRFVNFWAICAAIISFTLRVKLGK
jgi:hypothetical protein